MSTALFSSHSLFSSFAANQFNLHNRNNQGGVPVLQHCADCGAIQYPSREICHSCLSDDLVWRPIDNNLARVVSSTRLHHSLNDYFLPRLPWHILAVRLSSDNSGSLLVHSAEPHAAGDHVRLYIVEDHRGSATLLAVAPDEDASTIWAELNQPQQKQSDHL